VLRSLAEFWGTGGADYRHPQLHGALPALPDDWFVLLRALTGVRATPTATAELAQKVEQFAITRSDPEHIRADRSTWYLAIVDDVNDELRRRISEAANELDRLGKRQPWRK
jgi:hypothetical protein